MARATLTLTICQWSFLLPYLVVVARAAANSDLEDSTPTLRWRRAAPAPSLGFDNPSDGGGAWLTQVPDTFPAGQGEPINVVLSVDSDPAVLKDQNADGGLQNYFNALGYATECLGQHSGDNQAANLGDGNGYKNQTAVIRWDYGDPSLGTCEETVEGGSHLRYWTQNGPSANTGAIFLALSYEEPLEEQHNIIFNGYNLGRDWFVGNATNQTSLVPTLNVTNSSTYVGSRTFNNFTYQTSVQYMSGFALNTSFAVNHNVTVGSPTENADDGLIAVFTVTITGKPAASFAFPSRTNPPLSYLFLSLIFITSATLL